MSDLHPTDSGATVTHLDRDHRPDDHVHHTDGGIARGRRPMSGANWVGLFLLMAAIAFYLFFAIPEFAGIMGMAA